MKVSLSISLIAFAMIATAQTASAQESRGARFNYAPNVWKNEGARIPKGYGEYADPHHNVHAGAVPSKNLLGLDPMMLSKPAPVAPAAQAMPSVTAQVAAPRVNSNFNPLFGKPMQVAQLPPAMPQQALPLAMPSLPKANMATPQRHAPANHAQAPVRRSSSQAVSGRLLKPAFRRVTPQTATPQVASYGNHFGYEPGAYLPTSSGGSNARAEVSGRLIRH